jgi:hypothetical protein
MSQDALVAAQLVDRAAREHLALVEHGDGRLEPPHEVHVVLDDDDGGVLAERADEVRGARRLLARHARGRHRRAGYVRLRRDDHADLQPLLLAVRELARRRRRALVQSRASRARAARGGRAAPASRSRA